MKKINIFISTAYNFEKHNSSYSGYRGIFRVLYDNFNKKKYIVFRFFIKLFYIYTVNLLLQKEKYYVPIPAIFIEPPNPLPIADKNYIEKYSWYIVNVSWYS